MSSGKHIGNRLVVSALVLGGLAVPAADVGASDGVAGSVIVTRGTGQVSVRPDSVHVDVGVEARSETLDAAMSTVNTQMSEVIAALHGLERSDLTIATQNASFSPVYSAQNADGTQLITGYSASNHILVTVQRVAEDKLSERTSQIVDTALHAGSNQLGSVDFFVADPSDAQDRALTLAVKNAEHDAQAIAAAAGVRLTGAVSIEEESSAVAPRAFGIELALAPMSTPIETGDTSIQASVTAKYTFE